MSQRYNQDSIHKVVDLKIHLGEWNNMGIIISVSGNKNTEITINGKKQKLKII